MVEMPVELAGPMTAHGGDASGTGWAKNGPVVHTLRRWDDWRVKGGPVWVPNDVLKKGINIGMI